MRSKAMRQSKKKYFIFLSIAYFIFVLSLSTSVNASGIVLQTVTRPVTLTCSKSGKLS